jgi:hypothetical protein
MRFSVAGAGLLLLLMPVFACSASRPAGFAGLPEAGTEGGTDDGGTPLGTTDAASTPPAVAHLTGKVLAPEGTIPISGALLYLTPSAPGAIPDGVYCDQCVELSADTPYTTSNADGTFTLPAYALGSQLLVVEKGQFRRVRSVNVVAGDNTIDNKLTTLPAKMDKANGDDIPKMAVVLGQWDAIEISLAKLGLGQVDNGGLFGTERVVPGTASFDMLSDASILTDPNTISKYHIVFKPCSGSDGTTCTDTASGQSNVQTTLQDWVAAGGKFYVTDYSYDYIRQPWPGYVDWVDETTDIGSACLSDSYDAPATVDDNGLNAWLGAQGISTFTLLQSWTAIDHVNAVPTVDLNGMATVVTPKVWVEGQTGSFGQKPTTISFTRSCGRVLFSTYHTENGTGATAKLTPQELALLYVLLEVSVCLAPVQTK